MFKETLICVSIIILILLGNMITNKYTIKSIESLSNKLEEVKISINENKEKEDTQKNIEEMLSDFNSRHDKLAIYIEHAEIEKVELELESMQSYFEEDDIKKTITQIDKSVFLLKHLEDKYAFNLQNVF